MLKVVCKLALIVIAALVNYLEPIYFLKTGGQVLHQFHGF